MLKKVRTAATMQTDSVLLLLLLQQHAIVVVVAAAVWTLTAAAAADAAGSLTILFVTRPVPVVAILLVARPTVVPVFLAGPSAIPAPFRVPTTRLVGNKRREKER